MHADPITDDEWRVAALVAHGALLFHSAKAYGLVRGGPTINLPRCEELIARAQERGIEVDDNEAVAAFLVAARPS